jgi:signal transduction histidine kinase
LQDSYSNLERKVEERTKQLEAATQAKSRFLATASHDLRQPFQAMRLFHHILQSRLADNATREIATRLGEAMQAGEELLNALLDISTLEAGTVEPRLSDFPIQPMLTRLAQEFEAQGAAKGLDFRMVPSTAVVRSDPVLLERMLRNLLNNALRYTSRGGILLGCRRSGDRLNLAVVDTGIGIPREKQQAVFEDFFQISNPERDRSQGLGLGLPWRAWPASSTIRSRSNRRRATARPSRFRCPSCWPERRPPRRSPFRAPKRRPLPRPSS